MGKKNKVNNGKLKNKIFFMGAIVFCLFLFSCVSSHPKYSKERDLMGPLLQTEFKNIIESAPDGSRIGIDWCFDLRFEEGTVSNISDWVQRQIEKLLVDSKKFVVVTRRYLKDIQREQELQLSARFDEKTAISYCQNLGLSYFVKPEITNAGALSIQVIDAEKGQVFYVNIVDFY
ncbi:MAG: CsgG/HfaB family protein [Treponema sp.]|nr:CsgG/HfaB family protein [Treponema sp.]